MTKTRESIKALTEMAPSTASVVQEDGTTEEVEIDDVEEGDIVLVKLVELFLWTDESLTGKGMRMKPQ